VGVVKYFVDVGREEGYAFIDPVMTRCTIKGLGRGGTASGILKEIGISNEVQLIKCRHPYHLWLAERHPRCTRELHLFTVQQMGGRLRKG
jgi:hypothetical protein